MFERMILNRLNSLIETMIIDQQAGFRPGKSTTGQLLNLTQHIEDGYERGVVTGTVFVDISAAYDTISHKLLLNKICRMTSDIKFTDLIGNMLSNRRYFVELNGQKGNHLRANPDKTQTCVYHLRNRKANKQLNIAWCGKKLEHTPFPIYLGVTLDRTLSYSTHITKVKAKTAARNNVLRKLANSKWGTHPSTIKTTALALCYSTAEYACPVWERSAHAHNVDPVLNDACRAITGCLQPTNVENLNLQAGISPPAVRRSVTAQREREKQVNDNRHPLYGHNLPRKRLKSRNSFMHATDELIQSPPTRRLEQWSQHLQSVPHRLPQTPSACLASGASGTWTEWRCLNRLRTKMGRCKHNLRKWKYTDENDTTCDCKEADQTMEHLLECPLRRQTCSLDDLMVYNDVAKECVRQWIGLV